MLHGTQVTTLAALPGLRARVGGVDDFGRELGCLLYGLAWALATAVAVLVALILAGVL